MAFDFKKECKELYKPASKPSIVTVPPMSYVAVRGKGDPNTEGGEHQNALPFGAAVLDELAAMRPGQVRRMEAQVRPGDRFMPRWNLVVPALVADRRWEEPA